jgi:hypothetical protein
LRSIDPLSFVEQRPSVWAKDLKPHLIPLLDAKQVNPQYERSRQTWQLVSRSYTLSDLINIRRTIGKSGVVERRRFVLRTWGLPDRMDKASTPRTKPLSAERVHDLASIPDRQMKMGKFRFAGKPDQSKGRPTVHRLADMDQDTFFSQMAVLCLPAVLVVDNYSIPTLATCNPSAGVFS